MGLRNESESLQFPHRFVLTCSDALLRNTVKILEIYAASCRKTLRTRLSILRRVSRHADVPGTVCTASRPGTRQTPAEGEPWQM
jgi:hypothetical protein